VIIDAEGVVRYTAIGFDETAITALLGELLTVTSIGRPEQPEALQLITSYPNPFNAGTRIDFQLDQAAVINLTIFNAQGSPVRSLENNILEAGAYSRYWDARDNSEKQLPSGVYFAQISGANSRGVQKLLLLK